MFRFLKDMSCSISRDQSSEKYSAGKNLIARSHGAERGAREEPVEHSIDGGSCTSVGLGDNGIGI
jgi:hypothetical protein